MDYANQTSIDIPNTYDFRPKNTNKILINEDLSRELPDAPKHPSSTKQQNSKATEHVKFPTQIGLKKIIKSVKSNREIPTLKISLECLNNQRDDLQVKRNKNMSSLQINPLASPLNVPPASKTCTNGAAKQAKFAFNTDNDSRPMTSKN